MAVLWPALSLSASLFPDDWDDDFKDATAVFLPPGYDWRLLKATCIQESRLNPLAVSPVGAFGLCQFMPATAKEVASVLDVPVDSFWQPEVSIRAAGYYMGKGHDFWSSPRPPMDRIMLATAGYNAGNGNIHRAQKLCGNPILYRDIVKCLPRVTGRHSKETTDYVRAIVTKWWPMLLFD